MHIHTYSYVLYVICVCMTCIGNHTNTRTVLHDILKHSASATINDTLHPFLIMALFEAGWFSIREALQY